ncbi:hypothetical protein K432DRAFT_445374 [Lepidopterella palustris CBS 459.81]|uniref:Uncharacterized protein n=1 Tax=Lepidopterella palustris CBS 459.81 TaxID=1314670 RepID=A0A8E2JCC4_9PEZI|nr:hypothetical protein K432DRAFT_445374 [Lepidopterella palustris CBS 459.81]
MHQLPLLFSIALAALAAADTIAGPNGVSNITTLKPQFFSQYNSSRVQISYGPFTAPSSFDNNGMKDFGVRDAIKPCSNCLITFMEAGLQYPNGTYANADTGMWLHHTVMYNMQRNDTVCPQMFERLFASGNERTPINICVNGTEKAGYFLNATDHFAMLVELMNETEEPRDAVVTITYEYIPFVPAGFDTVTPLWLDIGNCTTSEMPAQANTTFEYSSTPWTSSITGQILAVGSHIHDGGTYLSVFQNDKLMCNCSAAYGQLPGYVESMPMNKSMMNMGMDMVHISSIQTCANDGTLKVGDTLSITAHYNTSEFSPMVNEDGTLAPIMGISLVYVAVGKNQIAVSSGTPSGTSTGAAAAASATSSSGAGSVGGFGIAVGGAMLGFGVLLGL